MPSNRPAPILSVASLAAAFAFATPLRAQHGDGLPTEYVLQIPPGGFVDLDSGVILPTAELRRVRADLRFGRDGNGFYLEPLHGGVRAARDDIAPPEAMAKDRVRIGRDAPGSLVLFARTDLGMARVELMVVDPYSTASAALRWVVVPPKEPMFLPAPNELVAGWQDGALVASWNGAHPRYLVELQTGETVKKKTVDEPRVSFPGLDGKGHHRIVVRGMSKAGEVGMPAAVVQFGPRRAPELGIAVYEDRWYDDVGGLSLTTGAVSGAEAEVVFYLYGVHVPGGGVHKVGNGSAEDFDALTTLPEGPFPPSYGRLDERDILVVQLADGRYAKLWLEPLVGDDVRDGMHVHFLFLPDGRRTLLPAPRGVEVGRTAGGPELSWQAVDGAASYRIAVDGGVPRETKDLRFVLAGLPPERLVAVQVAAATADGEQSAWVRLQVSTHALELRSGRGSLTAQQGGFDFTTGRRTANGAPSDLQLVGGAGGATVLRFGAKGIAAAGTAAFGEFAAAQRLELEPDFSSDAKTPGPRRVLRAVRDGSLACVRLLRRDWPTTTFEYVWQQRP
jgi:hypothetical protein